MDIKKVFLKRRVFFWDEICSVASTEDLNKLSFEGDSVASNLQLPLGGVLSSSVHAYKK